MTAVETAPNQAEMGLSSITSLLTQISNEIGSVKDVFSAVTPNSLKLNSSWEKRYLRIENRSYSAIEAIRNTTTDIFQMLGSFFSAPEIKESQEHSDEVLDVFVKNTDNDTIYGLLSSINNNTKMVNRALTSMVVQQPEDGAEPLVKKPEKKEKVNITTDSFYSSVLNFLKTISDNTKQKSQVNFLSGNFTKTKEDKPDSASKFDLTGFAGSVKTLNQALTPKFMKRLESFKTTLEKVLSFDAAKFKPFIEQFTKFGDSITEIAGELKPMTKTLFMLSGALIVFGIAGANPLIFVAIGAVTLMAKSFSKHFKDKSMPQNMLQFAYGIGVLSAAMIAMNFVNVGSMMMMLGFITMLGFALRTYRKTEIPALLGFSYAVGVLTLAMIAMNYVNFGSMLMMIGFIWGLGKALNGKTFGLGAGTGVELMKFAMGIGILTLALFAFAEIPIESPLMMLGFIVGLLTILKVMNRGKSIQATPLMSFAMGIGILTLALFAIDELPFSAMAKMIIFIIGVCLAVKLAGGKGRFSGFAGFAFGMGILVLAAYAIGELEWTAMAKFVVFLIGVSLAVRLMGNGPKSKLTMLSIAGGIIGIAIGMKVWMGANIGWENVFMLLTTMGGLGIAAALLGAMGVPALIGAGVMIALGGAVIVLALGLDMINKLDIDWGKIGMFGLGCLALAGTMALVTPLALIGLVGATLMIPIAISAGIAALSLMAISALTITPQNIDNFNYAVNELSWGFAKNTIAIGLGVAGAVLFMPIAATSLISAGVLSLISKITIDTKKIDSYNEGMKKIVDAINDYGLIQLGKVGLKSLALLPLMEVGLQMSQMMLNISNVKVSATDMQSFTNTLTTYIDTMAKAINDSVSKIEDCTPGIEAIAKLTGIAYTLAETVQKMANMEMVEHEEKNGQLVVKKVTKFDFSEANMSIIGKNIGSMIKAMTEPLVALASSSDEMIVGGVKIKNPFSKKNRKGIEFVQLIGESYKPIVESISSFAQLDIATDPTKFEIFKTNLLGTVDTLTLVFAKLSLLNPAGSESAVKSITAFIGTFNAQNVDGITKFNNEMSLSLSNLSDSAKWGKITKNLDTIKAKFYDISKAIKSIDIAKATAFENNLKLLVDKNNSAELAQSVNSLAELLGLVQEHQEKIQTEFSDRLGLPQTPSTTLPPTTDSKKKEPEKTPEDKFNQLVTDLLSAMEEISTKISGTNTKLGGTLKVQTVGANSNKI